VTEGRDQGTVAFPEADCKIFLTASPQERARRRQAQLQTQGIDVDGKDVLSQLQARDERDAQRPVGALHPADDAITVNTDQMNESEVVMQLVRLVEENLSQPGSN
jgi:cytidylate kinase